jgi:predicted nuclease of restriction endonuclease-like (RecB) superfamily
MEQRINLTQVYDRAAETIKTVILQGQYEAAKGVNRIQLATYFSVGKYVSANTRQGVWGTGALVSICERLHKILPGLRGFNVSQIKNMRMFYEAWISLDPDSPIANGELPATNSPFAIGELQSFDNEMHIFRELQLPNWQNFPAEDFFHVPFTHHCRILEKVKSLEERHYYIHRCAEEYMSVERLIKSISNDDFRHQAAIPNNFAATLPKSELARKAIMAFKDEYILDFINVEEIGVRDIDDIDERVVEKQIIHNIKNFIMTFGHDFAFMGNQYHLEVYGEEFFPDLIFFNRELNSLVVFELKTGKFKPSYLGQLSTYLRILDDKVRKPHENSSIGIILCKHANKEFVEYVIQDYDKPMGVATYRTSEEMPERLRKALPSFEELKKLL